MKEFLPPPRVDISGASKKDLRTWCSTRTQGSGRRGLRERGCGAAGCRPATGESGVGAMPVAASLARRGATLRRERTRPVQRSPSARRPTRSIIEIRTQLGTPLWVFRLPRIFQALIKFVDLFIRLEIFWALGL